MFSPFSAGVGGILVVCLVLPREGVPKTDLSSTNHDPTNAASPPWGPHKCVHTRVNARLDRMGGIGYAGLLEHQRLAVSIPQGPGRLSVNSLSLDIVDTKRSQEAGLKRVFLSLHRHTCILLFTSLAYPSLDCLSTTHTYTDHKQQSVKCSHHVERGARPCTIEQCTTGLCQK